MILFLYGADTFRSREKLLKIKKKFKESDQQGLNLTIFPEEVDFGKFRETIYQAPFLAKTRLVLLEAVFQNKKEVQVKIVEFLKECRIPDSTILVFWERGVPDQRGVLFKTLIKFAQVEEFAALSSWQLPRWIKEEVEKKGATISSGAVSELVLRVGNDLAQMSNEIDKLHAYVGHDEISKQAVQTLVKAKFETDIFKLVDALSQKDRRQALKFIHDQIALGAEKLYLLAMITYAFRNLILVFDLKERGFLEGAIAKQAALHPFVVKKTLSFVPKFNLSDLKRVYRKLLELDGKIKSGVISADFALSMLVLGVTG